MRVALYARVSTTGVQTGRVTAQDPEVQLSALRPWCEQRSYTIVRTYVDQGISGSKLNRPQFTQMLADAQDRAFDAIVVWKLDRFARSVSHLVNTINQLETYGVKFISMTDQIDMTSPAGKFMFHVMAAMSEFELALISERIKNGLRLAKDKGHVPGPKIKGLPSRSTVRRRRLAAQVSNSLSK